MGLFKRPRAARFKRETLSYSGELTGAERERLQEICQLLNGRGILRVLSKGYTVEGFRIKNSYEPKAYRLIDSKGDIWLYFLGCTDGTHAPEGFRETEWFLFCYKGLAAELHFEQQFTSPVSFLLKQVYTDEYRDIGVSGLNALLREKGIPSEEYYQALKDALDAHCGDRRNYYQF